jgi:hypothetical protein
MTADVITDKKKRKKTPVCLPVCVCGGGCGREVAVTGGWEGIEQFFLFGQKNQKKENNADRQSEKSRAQGGKNLIIIIIITMETKRSASPRVLELFFSRVQTVTFDGQKSEHHLWSAIAS